MLPVITQRARPPTLPDTLPPATNVAAPRQLAGTPAEAGDRAGSSASGDVAGAAAGQRVRGQSLPPGSGDDSGGVAPASTTVVETLRVSRDASQTKRSLLPTVFNTSPLPGALAAAPAPPSEPGPVKSPELATWDASYSQSPPGQSAVLPVPDAPSVQLLQHLHHLLQSGAPTAALQQWVSAQLCQATSSTSARRPSPVTVAVAGAARPTAPTSVAAPTAAVASGQLATPSSSLSHRPPRRPPSAVSFSLFSTYPHPHSPPQAALPDGTEAAHEPPSIPSTVGSTSTTGSANAAASSAEADADPLTPASAVVLVVAAPSPVPSAVRPLPPVSAAAPPAEREHPSSSVDHENPLCATGGGDDDVDAAAPSGGGGGGGGGGASLPRGGSSGLLKVTRPPLQHPQWRSFRHQSTGAMRASPTNQPGAAWSNSASVSAAVSAPVNVSHSTTPSPSGTPTHRHSAAALHTATKAAIHATTAHLVPESLQNISMMLGERFSRNPDTVLRRANTTLMSAPLSLSVSGGGGNGGGGVGSPSAQSRAAAAWAATSPHVVRRRESDAGAVADSSPIGAVTAAALERQDDSMGSLAPPQTRSPSVACAPRLASERAARSPTSATVAIGATGSPQRSAPSSRGARSVSPPSLMAAAMELSSNSAPAALSLQGRNSVSDDPSGLSIVSNDGDGAAAVAAAAPVPVRRRSNSIPQELPRCAVVAGRDGQQKRMPHDRRWSSGSSVAAAEAAADRVVEPPCAAVVVQDSASLIEIDAAAAEGSGRPARELTSDHDSSLFSGGGIDVPQAPRTWGGGEQYGHSSSPVRGTASTVSAVRAAAASATTPLVLAHLTGSASSPWATLATSLSHVSLSPSAAVAAQRTRPTSVTPRRTTSFVSTASSHLGCGGGHGASALNMVGRESFSLRDDLPSLASSRTAGVSSLCGDAVLGLRRHRTSVLHLSRSSMNGGVDPMMEGVMASFVLDDAYGGQSRHGPRFLRSYCRHTPVRVTESVAHEALEELGVPLIEGIDHASVPTNVLTLMHAYGFTDIRVFYVSVCLNVFLRYAFVRRFGWNTQRLKTFLEVAASFFRDGNPFHHPVHAVDVVIAAHQWLSEGSTAAALSDEEVMTFLLAAMVVQLAHTGADNRLLAQLRHPYAMLCSYASPQQGATVALVMALLCRPDLRFFPAPHVTPPWHGAAAAAAAATAMAATHEWTASRETQMYDRLADLLMASDERNHFTLKESIVRIGEENARRHGCLCAGGRFDRSLSVSNCSRHPPRSVSQSDGAARLQNPSTLGNFCLSCCAYITDAHVPDLLKAVLHFVDFAYLFRPYEVYLCGNIAYTAEVYRQSERECEALQRLQRQEQERRLESALGRTEPAQPAESGWPSSARGPEAPFSSSPTDASPPAVSFATAFLAEQPSWRQGVGHASTKATLLRSGEDGILNTAAAADTPPPSRRVTAVTPPSAMTTANVSTRPSLTTLDGLPQAPTVEEVGEADAPTFMRPLWGLGRDIVLISLEELCLPFLEQLAPYMPDSWVAATYLNHQRLMKMLPTPETFDAVVEELLGLGEETDAERLDGDSAAAAAATAPPVAEEDEVDELAAERPFTLPWRLLRPLRPMAAQWTVNEDGLVRRVVEEIMRGPEALLQRCDEY
ncbi:3'5'-cyclic nucleotide phosphodiesterase [Novymonas esmeraldas]|uniref:3'5'-cyclic nucleotide phosphodiesterase n=1 Tax=Novymonas esmeraldas TaxID=1808958 RepID=A0AAW0EV60_9TRYP